MDISVASKETVLIVDDDPANIGFLGPIMKNAGYEVLAVQAAEKVLPIIRSKQPDIVLLDISMPKLDGYAICALILAEPCAERIPVIFITGRNEPEDIVRGFEAGAVDFLVKPIKRIELLGRMRNHLDRRRYERSLSEEKERFRILTENVGEAFILLDAKFSTISYVNPAFERIFGFSIPELPAPTSVFDSLMEPEERDAVRAMTARAVTGEGLFNRESKIRRPDGTVRWIWARATMIESQGHKGFISVVEDITDRKIAERQLIEALDQESRMAGTIQRSLLMNETALDFPGFECVLVSIPSKNIDGDFFDVFPLEEAFDVVVGDVMGKGLHAALIGAAAKSSFLRAHAKLGASCRDRRIPDTTHIVQEVDRAMAKRLIGLNSFFTVQYMRFSRAQGYLEYVDCGHTPIIVWDGEACWAYKGLNPPIGFFENQVFALCRVPLRPGDLAFVYSDGVTEAKAADGELFGEARLFESIRRNVDRGPAGLVERIRSELEDYSEGRPSGDDVTLAVFKLGDGPPVMLPRRDRTAEFCADLDRLSDIRTAVGEFLSAYGPEELGEKARDLAVLAAVESASNVIIHGLAQDAGRKFALRLEARDGWYSMTFRYPGEDFIWTRDRASRVDAMDESGYGLFIIRNAMKSFVVSRSDTGLIEIILVGETEGANQ